MTYADEVEVRQQTSVGAKVLIFAVAILAVLAAFWAVVWFIRAYVEQPRVNIAPPITLAARESQPSPPQAQPAAPSRLGTAAVAEPAPQAAQPQMKASLPQPPAHTPAPNSGAIADRWLPQTQSSAPAAAAPPPPPAMTVSVAPAVPAPSTEPPSPPAEAEPAAEEVVAVMQPAIAGPAPLPRRKPANGNAKLREPPLPRPRPDGSAPQSVWTAVPVADDRFPSAATE